MQASKIADARRLFELAQVRPIVPAAVTSRTETTIIAAITLEVNACLRRNELPRHGSLRRGRQFEDDTER